MFILNCICGNEIFGDEEDDCAAWQCDACGKWFNYFGQEVPPPGQRAPSAAFKDFDPDFEDEDDE